RSFNSLASAIGLTGNYDKLAKSTLIINDPLCELQTLIVGFNVFYVRVSKSFQKAALT
ncbi:MAG: hypothetical protein ACJAS1_003737, partial [Oleiphilaceae bacterium]